MKAAVIHEHGDVNCIRVEDVAEPVLQAGEALVRVRAAALNHLDVWVRGGGRMKVPLPHILGSDGAGVVERVAPDVKTAGETTYLSPGREVVIHPGIWCGRCTACLAGRQSYCPDFGIVGMARPGTYAQFVAVPAASLRPKPAHLSFAQASALPLAHLTAWRMLVVRAELTPGETALIHGIGGGVALAGLQLAKMMSAVAIATSASDEKLARAASLGADHGINYKKENVAERVKAVTNGRGADVILDTVGSATWETNFAAAAHGGRLVHCGVTGGAAANANVQALYWNQFSILGSRLGTADDFRSLLDAAAAAKLAPVIDSTYPLEDIRDATSRMEKGEQFGKIVLRMPE
jgi:NADPH:quinone reductase-like Zn-dependent oxidoreductase